MPTSSAVIARVPAHAANISFLRDVVAAEAGRIELTVDQIDDLLLAVGEATAVLMELDGTVLEVIVDSDAGAVRVDAGTDAMVEPWPPAGWADSITKVVLDTLATDVAFATSDRAARVRFTKHI